MRDRALPHSRLRIAGHTKCNYTLLTQIIKDEHVTPNNETSFLSILSSLLKLPTHDVKYATKSHCKPVTLPLIQKFAENFRVRSGERLTKHAIRHAMGKAAPSVIEGSVTIGAHDDEVVMVYENKVKPSMIKGLCSTKACFNSGHVVARSGACLWLQFWLQSGFFINWTS